MSDTLPIPPELAALIGRNVKSLAGVKGEVRDVVYYSSVAGQSHGAGWCVTVVNEYGARSQNDLATFNAIWSVVK
jgi:hypothetical protein